QLLDIHLHLSQIATYLVRSSFSFLLAFLLLFLGWSIFPNAFTPLGFALALTAFLATILLTVRYFPQFYGKGEDRLERRILGDRFKYHDKIRELTQHIRSHPDPQTITRELHDVLIRDINLKHYQIIVVDETTRTFSIYQSHPEHAKTPLADMQANSPVFRYFLNNPADFLGCKMAYGMPGETELEHAARTQLSVFDPEFCFPFFGGEDPFGMLLLGPKKND